MGVEVAGGLEPDIDFKKVDGVSKGYWAFVIVAGIIAAIGVLAWLNCYINGHGLTNLNNRVTWGLLIIGIAFSVGLGVGATIVILLSEVGGFKNLRPLSRFAAILAILWTFATLTFVMFDIGRMENMMAIGAVKIEGIIPYPEGFNPTSVFAWNGVIYPTFIVACAAYILANFEDKLKLRRFLSVLVFIWAVIVVTLDGSLFGLIFSRSLYHSPLLAPLFTISAVSSGLAFMILLLVLTFKSTNRHLSSDTVRTLSKIMGVFIAATGYMIICEFFTIMYEPENFEKAIFAFFSPFNSFLYWGLIFTVGIGLPILIIWNPLERIRYSIGWLTFASILHLIGMWSEKFMSIIPGLEVTENLLSGYELVYPSYLANIVFYVPNAIEWAEFIGIISGVLTAYALCVRFLAILPEKG